MRAAIALALSLVTFAASTAAAQPSTQPAAEPEVVQYGGALVIFDLIGIGAAALGASMVVKALDAGCDDCTGDESGSAGLGAVLVLGGTITYAVGPPVVHGRMGNKLGAGKSFLMRLFFPVVGAVGGMVIGGDDADTEDKLYGLAAGTAAAVLIDWTIVSRVKRPTSAYTPTVTPVRDGGMTFGLAGSF